MSTSKKIKNKWTAQELNLAQERDSPSIIKRPLQKITKKKQTTGDTLPTSAHIVTRVNVTAVKTTCDSDSAINR